MFLGSHFLKAAYNLTLEKLEKELKAIMRPISQHASMGHWAEINFHSYSQDVFSPSVRWRHYPRCWREKSINRPDKNLYPSESYMVAGDNSK